MKLITKMSTLIACAVIWCVALALGVVYTDTKAARAEYNLQMTQQQLNRANAQTNNLTEEFTQLNSTSRLHQVSKLNGLGYHRQNVKSLH